MRNIKMLCQVHKQFAADKRYRLLNLLKAMWLVSKSEKVVEHDGVFVYSSFLPPIPSEASMQVFHATKGQGTLFDDHIHARRKAPISMYIAVTAKCRYNCPHCSSNHRNYENEMTTSEIKNLVGELQEMGTAIIGFTGGEPMLRKDIVEIISMVDPRSIPILFTSGDGLDLEKAHKLKEAGLFSVGISLDAPNRETVDKKRGYPGAFDNALTAVKNGLDAGLYVIIQGVMDKISIQDGTMMKMVEFAKKLGVHELRFLENFPSGRLARISLDMVLTHSDREKMIAFHKEANRLPASYPKVTVFAHTEQKKLFGCGAGTQHSYIDASGNLCPCDFVPLKIGNIHDKPIRQLWEEMNSLISVPRDRCMILELHKELLAYEKGSFPLETDESKKLLKEMRQVQSLPGFYTTLKGKN